MAWTADAAEIHAGIRVYADQPQATRALNEGTATLPVLVEAIPAVGDAAYLIGRGSVTSPSLAFRKGRVVVYVDVVSTDSGIGVGIFDHSLALKVARTFVLAVQDAERPTASPD